MRFVKTGNQEKRLVVIFRRISNKFTTESRNTIAPRKRLVDVMLAQGLQRFQMLAPQGALLFW